MSVMRNYSAWEINPEDFKAYTTEKKRMQHILQYGLLAPSMHNTQPWKISLKKNSAIITRDKQYDLPVGDYNSRGYYFGLGCFLANVEIASRYYGYKVTLSFQPKKAVMMISFKKKQSSLSKKKADQRDLEGISKRRTNRSAYKDKQLPSDVTEYIESLNSSILKTVLLQAAKKNEYAILAGQGSAQALGNKNFRSELAKFMRKHDTRAYRGMPGSVFDFPKILTHIIPLLLPIVNPRKKVEKKDTKLVSDSTKYMLLIATSSDDKESWFDTGYTYQYISVKAAQQGIYLHPLYGTVYHEDLRKEVQKKYTGSMYPQFVARIGEPIKQAHHTPRLLIQDIIS